MGTSASYKSAMSMASKPVCTTPRQPFGASDIDLYTEPYVAHSQGWDNRFGMIVSLGNEELSNTKREYFDQSRTRMPWGKVAATACTSAFHTNALDGFHGGDAMGQRQYYTPPIVHKVYKEYYPHQLYSIQTPHLCSPTSAHRLLQQLCRCLVAVVFRCLVAVVCRCHG